MTSLSEAIENIYVDEKAFDAHALIILACTGLAYLCITYGENSLEHITANAIFSIFFCGYSFQMVNNTMNNKAQVLPDLGLNNIITGLKFYLFILLSLIFLGIGLFITSMIGNIILIGIYIALMNIIIIVSSMVFAHELKISDAFNFNKFFGFVIEYFIPLIIASIKMFLLAIIPSLLIVASIAFLNLSLMIAIPIIFYLSVVGFLIYFNMLGQVYAKSSLAKHFS